jgi:hypothetical protein
VMARSVELCLDRVSSVAMAVPWASVGWSRGVSARWGRARGPSETASIHWGLATVLVVEAKERERVLAGQQPRAPPLPLV